MQVKIKKFVVDMNVKANGIEFEVRTPDGSTQIGDCFLTMTGLVWCKGRKGRKNGINISWEDFMEIMKSKEAKKAALKAAKSV
jgi:hypothetical protein